MQKVEIRVIWGVRGPQATYTFHRLHKPSYMTLAELCVYLVIFLS